jgi:hypothetical protein
MLRSNRLSYLGNEVLGRLYRGRDGRQGARAF